MEAFDAWNTELYHHGILGMKWGVRRYQNEDGSLTALGLRRQARQERLSYKLQTKNERARLKEAAKQGRIRLKSEKKRKLNSLSDEELDAKLARVRKIDEIKGLSKKKSLAETIADAKEKHNEYALKKMDFETRQIQAKAQAKQAKYQEKKSWQEFRAKRQEKELYNTDAKKQEIKTEYKKQKIENRKNTIHGAIGIRIANMITRHGGKSLGEISADKKNARLKAQLQTLNLNKKIKEIGVEESEPSIEEKEARARRRRSHYLSGPDD